MPYDIDDGPDNEEQQPYGRLLNVLGQAVANKAAQQGGTSVADQATPPPPQQESWAQRSARMARQRVQQAREQQGLPPGAQVSGTLTNQDALKKQEELQKMMKDMGL